MSTCIRAGATFKRHVYGKDCKTCKKCGHVKGIFSGEADTGTDTQPSGEATQTTETQQVADDITHNENETMRSDLDLDDGIFDKDI